VSLTPAPTGSPVHLVARPADIASSRPWDP
jgi:hypothetical protein